ncbi:retrotransposon protein, putative, ty1-copia subclass [Tanacetum coccineum]
MRGEDSEVIYTHCSLTEKGLKDKQGFNAERKLTYGGGYNILAIWANWTQAVLLNGHRLAILARLACKKLQRFARMEIFVKEISYPRIQWRDSDQKDDHIAYITSENTSDIPVEPERLKGILENLLIIDAAMIDHDKRDLSPVADNRAIRILIAIAAYYDYEIWQMDVKTAFLNGRLDEDIYMEQPEGYVDPKFPNGVCKLQRAIYGLKQASRQWNKRFDEEIKRFGFIQILMSHVISPKQWSDDLGEAAYILGIKIYRDRSLRLIGLNQSAYIDKILKKFNMQNSKKGFIPMEVKHDLSNEMCASSDEEKACGVCSKLVSPVSTNPRKLHWVAVKHILKYLRNTKDMFLVYGGNPDTELDVTGFCDASWQCDKDDTKSQTGYVFVVNGGAVDWKSKKQTTIAMHATQSEYMAASEAAIGAFGLRKFVEDWSDAQ